MTGSSPVTSLKLPNTALAAREPKRDQQTLRVGEGVEHGRPSQSDAPALFELRAYVAWVA